MCLKTVTILFLRCGKNAGKLMFRELNVVFVVWDYCSAISSQQFCCIAIFCERCYFFVIMLFIEIDSYD